MSHALNYVLNLSKTMAQQNVNESLITENSFTKGCLCRRELQLFYDAFSIFMWENKVGFP